MKKKKKEKRKKGKKEKRKKGNKRRESWPRQGKEEEEEDRLTDAGVLGLTKADAVDYAADGIRVNAVCPGYLSRSLSLSQ